MPYVAASVSGIPEAELVLQFREFEELGVCRKELRIALIILASPVRDERT